MNEDRYDYVVLGAGPAGLQLGYYLAQRRRRFCILERASHAGAFFDTFPRHRKLISVNKLHTGYSEREINLRWDWNSLLSDDGPLFRDYSPHYFPPAEKLVDYCRDFASRYALPIHYGCEVRRVSRPDDFHVECADSRSLRARCVVVATGVSAENRPSIPGLELCESYAAHSTCPADYTGQRVLIIGKGNSAFETADNLIETASLIHLVSRHPLKMAWKTHFVGDLRACNNNVLDTYQLKLQNAVLDAEVVRIERQGDRLAATFRYAHADGEVETIEYDRIISCAGFRLDTSIFADDTRPRLTSCGRLPVQSAAWESVNVPDMYFAGTLMQQRDYKRYMSAFIHGFRYNVRTLATLLDARYHGASWPQIAATFDHSELTARLIERINQTSALWQQPGFLCDVVRYDRGSGRCELIEELSVDLAREKLFANGAGALLLTLEFGHSDAPDPFHVERVRREDYRRAERSQFLHPVLRYYEGGALVTEHHVIEDLAAEWVEPEHVEPLRSFLQQLFLDLGATTALPTQAAQPWPAGLDSP